MSGALALAMVFCGLARGADGWELTLERLPRGEEVTVSGTGDSFDGVTLPDGTRLPIRAQATRRETPEAIRLRLRLENAAEGWRIAGFRTVPFRTRSVTPDMDVYRPIGLGRRTAFTNELETLTYPGNTMTMPFLVIGNRERSVYFGCHDPAAHAVGFALSRDAATGESAFRAVFSLSLHPGQSQDCGETVLREFARDWHAAARFYRAWYDGCKTMARPDPAWPREMSGWLLVIMRQQNGQSFWNYDDIGKGICDYADRLGLDTIGLFGWTKGGHDHLYPDYDPSEEMGGAEGLRRGIAAAKARGKRVIIYANGQLQQVGATEFWKTDGERLALENRDGTFVTHHYHKYRDIPKYDFRLGCLHGKAWYDRMLFLAEQANGFGADGILYDQFGIGSPFLCWGRGHGHATPAYSYEAERVGFIRGIRDAVRAKNPEFTVSTEGVHDSIFQTIDFFHGYARGVFGSGPERMALRFRGKDDGTFPELVRYTFPELVMTGRVPVPIVGRGMVNYSLLFGLRHDVEVRYGPDRTFIETGKRMERADYGTVCDVPSLKIMNAAPLDEQAAYVKAANDFRRVHADLLLRGDFVDTDGFVLEGEGLFAKRYVGADGASGVLVWNVSKEPRSVGVKGLGAATSVSEIGRAAVDASEPLAPDTLRLYRFASALGGDAPPDRTGGERARGGRRAVRPDAGWRPTGVFTPERGRVESVAGLPPESIALFTCERN